MQESDKKIIREFAGGNKSLRAAAIAIYRYDLLASGQRVDCPEFRFMSEIDNPCPDLGLRARYRAAVLAAREAPDDQR